MTLLPINSFFETLLSDFENSASKIFMCGIFLIGAGFAGYTQIIPALLEHEQIAMEARYEFEEKSGIDLYSFENCASTKENTKICRFARYKEETAKSNLSLSMKIIGLMVYLGVSLIPFSLIAYVSSICHRSNGSHNNAEKQEPATHRVGNDTKPARMVDNNAASSTTANSG